MNFLFILIRTHIIIIMGRDETSTRGSSCFLGYAAPYSLIIGHNYYNILHQYPINSEIGSKKMQSHSFGYLNASDLVIRI